MTSSAQQYHGECADIQTARGDARPPGAAKVELGPPNPWLSSGVLDGALDVVGGDVVVGGVPDALAVLDEEDLGGLMRDAYAVGEGEGNVAGLDDFEEVDFGRGIVGGLGAFDEIVDAGIGTGGDGAACAVFEDEYGLFAGPLEARVQFIDGGDLVHGAPRVRERG